MAAGLKSEPCCLRLAKYFLVTVNLLTAAIGLLLCAGGAYLWIEYERQFSDVVSEVPILGVLIVGAALFLLTMIGIYGALTRNRKVLTIYLFVVCLAIALEVILAIIFLQYLEIIEHNQTTSSTELQDKAEIFINNFVYRSYDTCCVANAEFCAPTPGDDTASPLYCTPAPFCGNETFQNEGCVLDFSSNPTTEIDEGVCLALAEFSVDGEPLVGPTSPGNNITCGGGFPLHFEAAISEWLTANINFFGYGALAVGILELLIVGFGVGLMLVSPSTIVPAHVVQEEVLGIDPNRISVAIPVGSVRQSQRVRSVRSVHSSSSGGPGSSVGSHRSRSDRRTASTRSTALAPDSRSSTRSVRSVRSVDMRQAQLEAANRRSQRSRRVSARTVEQLLAGNRSSSRSTRSENRVSTRSERSGNRTSTRAPDQLTAGNRSSVRSADRSSMRNPANRVSRRPILEREESLREERARARAQEEEEEEEERARSQERVKSTPRPKSTVVELPVTTSSQPINLVDDADVAITPTVSRVSSDVSGFMPTALASAQPMTLQSAPVALAESADLQQPDE